jgi:hypothetical protein
MFNFDFKNRGFKKGFSIIELTLIMFIVSFAFTGIYVILAKISQHEKDGRYNLIAANLAQEGVEIIRNKRDNGALAGQSMDGSIPNESKCYPYLEASSDAPKCDDTDKSEIIGLNGEEYEHCSGGGCGVLEETVFSRECSISGDNNQKQVSCTVSWESPTLEINKDITLESVLTDWQTN